MTDDEMSKMVQACVLGDETPLAKKYPEFWADLKKSVESIQKDGYIVDIGT